MKEIKGENLLATLIKLLAEQEGVKIKYEFQARETAHKVIPDMVKHQNPVL